MSNSMITFSIKGACSYAWNKNHYNGYFKLVNIVHCLATLVYAVFNKYQVEVCEVREVYKKARIDYNYKAIFFEEYKQQISDRDIELESDTIKFYTDRDSDADANLFVNHRSSLLAGWKISTQTVSPEEFKGIIKDGSFTHNIHYIIEGDLIFDADMDLVKLPDYMTITGNALINRCDNLICLPKKLKIDGVFEHIQSVGVTLKPN